ncbi:MAG: glycosyltransferase family 39 protein [Rhodocyclaceae bacterium]|nr:glycosyltransferase family 39 protein [Rhodocyclaceae bacterium]
MLNSNRAVPPGLTFPAGPVLLLIVLAAVALAARPVTPIDETRYVSVAWDMWQRGDYLVLFKNGAPYSHKPPLLFWLINLGWAVTGVNEWWPRLVSPLFSFGCLLLTVSLGRRLWPGDDGSHRNSVWILASSLLWMLFSTSVMFDVMLAFFALLGMRGLLIAADGARTRGFAWLAVAIGCGVLAKGPVVLLHLLPVAALAPWWRPGLPWKHWAGGVLLAVLGGAAIALAWAIPASLQGGEEYRRMIFWGQTADRMVDSFAHKRPFWWYLPLLPALLYPWLVWPAFWRRLAALQREGLDGGLRFCLAWMLPAFVSFSFISGKQVHYLIPLFPAFALFAGHLMARSKDGATWLPALLAGAVAAAMLYFCLAAKPKDLATWQNFPAWPGLALALAAVLSGWIGRRPGRRLHALALLSATAIAMVQFYVAGNAWLRYDVGPIAGEIRKLQDRGVAVANHGDYHAQYQFPGRLARPLDQVHTPADVQAWFDRHPEGVLVGYLSPKSSDLSGEALFSQPYRGEFAMLLNADQARAQGLLGPAK